MSLTTRLTATTDWHNGWSGILEAGAPNTSLRVRRQLGEAIEVLQCWSGGEAIVVATVFLIPQTETITRFVFDASDACQHVLDATGDECLLVSGELLLGGIAANVAFALGGVLLGRVSAAELHGYFSEREGEDDAAVGDGEGGRGSSRSDRQLSEVSKDEPLLV